MAYSQLGAVDESTQDEIMDDPEPELPQIIPTGNEAEDLKQVLDVPAFRAPKAMRKQTPKQLACDLLEHQKVCLSWLLRQENNKDKLGSLLADTMGLGKTVQALALIFVNPPKNPEIKTTLIVAPKSLLQQWETEIIIKVKEHFKRNTMILHGKAAKDISLRQMLGQDIVLCTYGKLVTEYKILEAQRQFKSDPGRRPESKPNKLLVLHPQAKFHRIILDEAHNIKNRTGVASLAACSLQATYRLCMTGTPLMNRADEIYPLIRFLGIKPYNDWEEFCRDIDGPIRKLPGRDGVAGLRKLRTLLRSIMLRRTHDSILDNKPIIQLPARREVDAHTTFDEEQERYYRALETKQQLKFNKYLQQGTVMRHYFYILALLTRLRQACDHPHLIKDHSGSQDTILDDTNESNEEIEPTEEEIQQSIDDQNLISCNICHDFTEQAVTINPCGHTLCSTHYNEILKDELEMMPSIPELCDEIQVYCPVNNCEILDRLTLQKITMHGGGSTSKKRATESSTESMNKKRRLQADHQNSEQSDGNKSVSLSELRNHAIGRLKEMRDYHRRIRKDFVASAKTDKIISILKTIRAGNEGKTLVFSLWTSFLDLLEIPMVEARFRYKRFDGSMGREDRDAAVKAFMEDPSIKVMLLSLTAGNAGLNLTAATHVIICEPFWNPYTEEQAIGRAHRIGQTKEVTIYRVLIANTVEDRILGLQNYKKALVGAALSEEGAAAAEALSVNEFQKLFGIS